MSGIRISQWTATAGIKEGTEELVRSGALPLVWGEALETRLFPESSGRLATVVDVPGLPDWRKYFRHASGRNYRDAIDSLKNHDHW